MSILSRWRAKHLLFAWIAYWVALVAISLHSPLAAVMRALNAPKGQGSIGASIENGSVILKVTASSQTWIGSTSLTTLVLWFAGPPLLLWLLWLVTRRAPVAAREPERDYRVS